VRVLLCERNELLRNLLLELLADEGVSVVVCSSLQEINAALASDASSVVLTDSWLPSRVEVSEAEVDEIRRLAERCGVVVTTARSWPGRTGAPDLGERVAFVPKPYDLDDILAALQRVAHATLERLEI
jgi:DNA-binding NtrC family response regulator